MAAVDLVLGVTQVLELSATPNTMQEVTFPENARTYLLQFRGTAGKLLLTGGTDAAVIVAEVSHQVVANQIAELDVPGAHGRTRNLDAATRKVWLASATASQVAEITAL